MAGETSITLVGNLTADPELRYTQAGAAVTSFTIASTPKVFDRQAGEWKDGDPLFLRASVWRDFAEHVSQSLTKGTRVVAQGRLRQRQYETREGEKRTSYELDIDAIGPDLRYATAQVARTPRRDAQAPGQVSSPQDGGAVPGGRHYGPLQPEPSGDGWNPPGGMDMSTPF
jgi:single-strand binding protein